MTRIKVCCIQDSGELDLAVRYGASAVGLVSAMPSGPGVIPEGRISALIPAVPATVSAFLLTAKTEPAEVVEQGRRFRPDVIQLVDRVPAGAYERIRAELPGIGIAQVIHVAGAGSVEEARELAPEVDMLLLDSGRPDAEVKELGGTGRTHDWSVSREIREAVDVPVWLAGGLSPENAADAVAAVDPHGVDVCSGLRPDGSLDEGLLARFVEAVRSR